jgi:single-strand DNA-binding protein
MSQITINRVVLVGRLTRDPELRSLPSGRSVTSLRLACNASRRDAEGNSSERANYFDISAFGATAESVCRFTRKGSRVGIDGRLEWREWETAEQEHRQAVSVVADVVQFLDSPGSSAGDRDGGDVSGEDRSRELVGVGADELDVTF